MKRIAYSLARVVALGVFLLGLSYRHMPAPWGVCIALILAVCYLPVVEEQDDRTAWRVYTLLALLAALSFDSTMSLVLLRWGWDVRPMSDGLLRAAPLLSLVGLTIAGAVWKMSEDDLHILADAVAASVVGTIAGLGALLLHIWLMPSPAEDSYLGFALQSVGVFTFAHYNSSCAAGHRTGPSAHLHHLEKHAKTINAICVGTFAIGIVVAVWS